MELESSIQYVKGVGPHLARILGQKNITTLEDALYFLPRSYEDRQNFKKIKDLKPGERETSFGVIRRVSLVPMRSRKRQMFIMTLADASGVIQAKWFRFNEQYMHTRYKIGMQVVFTGEVKIFQYQKEITHPDIEVIDDPTKGSLHFGRIVPIYSQTEGLYQKTIRKIVHNALTVGMNDLEDPIPPSIRERQKLLDLKKSFQEVHYPTSFAWIDQARKRLVFDEFFFLELGLALRKKSQTREKTTPFQPSQKLKPEFLKQLPFELTQAQKNAISEIETDLGRPYPMSRLLQGDVGSGKTVVAVLSSLSVLEHGRQIAMMAPTEILAEQHFHNLAPLLLKIGIRACLLKSEIKKSDKSKLLQEIKTGVFQCVFGTHAIIQSEVQFKNLGFVIIDEQHRFGVEQRLQLKKKGETPAGGAPHLLVMTATPIPRTLALTVYGDLDLSVMDELPQGRKPIHTKVVLESQRLKLYDFMKKELAQKKQAYVVYPLIEESEKIDLKDATQMTEHLKTIFKDFRVELIHGRMKSDEKNKIMQAFQRNKIQVLVSTTVIEVGIDVPNSTIMVVEHAERFGLSQLHQLRGRVGRGTDKSYCFLLAHFNSTEESRERLKAMETFQSGFKIAEVDLQLRGPGEFLGKLQSGLGGFRVANIATDAHVLLEARKEAFQLVEKDPTISAPEHAVLKTALKRRWQDKLNLIAAG